ncbi:factor associated with metabolism and energy-like isoform X3 [Mobula birostris]
MGLCSSKVSHKMIKVTPVTANETGGLDQLPGGADGERLKHGEPLEISKSRRSDLPPLKERHVAGVLQSHQQVPTAISFDINPVDGETSIIKKHPPRRFQGLEPINGCTVITSEKLLEKRAANARKVQCKVLSQSETTYFKQAQEIQAEIAKQFSRRRQQIEKMQYEKIR